MKTQGSKKQKGELDADQAAAVIGVSANTVRRFMQQNLIPHAHRQGGKVVKESAAHKVKLARIAKGSNWIQVVIWDDQDSFGPTQLPLMEAPKVEQTETMSRATLAAAKELAGIARKLKELGEYDLSIKVSERVIDLASA